MQKIPCGPNRPAHTHTSAGENIKLHVMMNSLEERLKSELKSISTIEKTSTDTENLRDTYTITYTDDTTTTFTVTNGAPGEGGKSAYDLAKDAGFEGTQKEWLESLKGANGEDGRDIVIAISDDKLVWFYKDDENDPTKYNFIVTLADLKGEKGEDGTAFTYDMLTPEQKAALKGEKGDQGEKGEQGPKGTDGRGISNILPLDKVGLVNTYSIYYTDGTVNTFTVTDGKDGEQGPQGVGIVDIIHDRDDEAGNCVYKIKLSNGTFEEFIAYKGKDGTAPSIKVGELIYAPVDNIVTLPNFITEIPAEYITENELESKGYLTEHQSLENYATKVYVTEAVTKAVTDSKVDLDGYATETYVDEAVSKFITEIPTEYVTETELNNKGYLIGSDLGDYAKKTDLFSKSYNDLTDKPAIPSIEGLATEDYVDNAIKNITHPTIPTKLSELTNDVPYATEQYVTDAIANQVPVENLASKYEVLEVKQELSQNITQIETKVVEEIKPTVSELKTWVENKEYLQDIDLADYALKTEVEAKADKVLFTTAKFVTKPLGNFVEGEDIAGLSIAELFAKLLGLSDTKPGENPDTPTEPEGVVEEIVANKIPMYSVNAVGKVVEISYDSVITYTKETASEQPTESGFYQITDEVGKVIESGYQELTVNNPDVPYIIALPSGVDFSTMVSTQTYDTLEGKWKNDSFEMSNDFDEISALCEELSVDISDVDKTRYTLWADLEAGPTGKIHRFIITE